MYEAAEAFVVRAASEEQARAFASRAAGDEGSGTWTNTELSSCLPIEHEGEPGVILRDFSAG